MIWDIIFTFVINWGLGLINAPIDDARPKAEAFLSMHIGDKMSELPPVTIKHLNASEHWDLPKGDGQGWHHFYEVKMPNNPQGYYKVTFNKEYKIIAIAEDWSWFEIAGG